MTMPIKDLPERQTQSDLPQLSAQLQAFLDRNLDALLAVGGGEVGHHTGMIEAWGDLARRIAEAENRA